MPRVFLLMTHYYLRLKCPSDAVFKHKLRKVIWWWWNTSPPQRTIPGREGEFAWSWWGKEKTRNTGFCLAHNPDRRTKWHPHTISHSHPVAIQREQDVFLLRKAYLCQESSSDLLGTYWPQAFSSLPYGVKRRVCGGRGRGSKVTAAVSFLPRITFSLLAASTLIFM